VASKICCLETADSQNAGGFQVQQENWFNGDVVVDILKIREVIKYKIDMCKRNGIYAWGLII
jgi:hypothetical protein